MKLLLCIFSLFLSFGSYSNSNDNGLKVLKEGLIVVVVDFKEGDKLKLFEFESGEHILSKTRGQIDLSMLPSGKYLLENSEGKSAIIEKKDEDLFFEKALDDTYMVDRDSKRIEVEDMPIEEELESFYSHTDDNLLAIEREGDIITVVDFQEGDIIKLFEVKNTVHVLSKTEGYIDLSQLPVGVYFIKNNKGDSVIVEKFANAAEQFADM